MHLFVVNRPPSGCRVPSNSGTEAGKTRGTHDDAVVVASRDVVRELWGIYVQSGVQPANRRLSSGEATGIDVGDKGGSDRTGSGSTSDTTEESVREICSLEPNEVVSTSQRNIRISSTPCSIAG